MKTMKDVIELTCSTDEQKELFEAVIDQMGEDWDDIWEYPQDRRDASGGVSGFIYYVDTDAFAKKHMYLIMDTIFAYQDEIGEAVKIPEDNRLNWLAWFALESVIQKVMDVKEGIYDES